MTNEIMFTLPGTPTPKGRPRFFNGRAVTDEKTRAAEQSILAAYLTATTNRQPHDGPVSVELLATFAPAESWPQWKRSLALTGVWPHIARPDLDNLIKILDGLNGIAWIDDSQIIEVQARKQYGASSSTQVTLTLHPQPTKPTKEKKQ